MAGYDYCEPDMINLLSYRDIENKFYGEISWVDSPSDFYVNIVQGKDWSAYLDLVEEMQKFYKKYHSKCYIDKGTVGQLVAVKTDGKSHWQRGCIKKVISRDIYDVFMIDSGYTQYDTDERDIRLLRDKYADYCPAQAIPVRLAFIEPVKGHWSKSAVSLVKDYMDRELYIKCISTEMTKECCRYPIVLLDKYKENYIITNKLVKHGYAEFSESTEAYNN